VTRARSMDRSMALPGLQERQIYAGIFFHGSRNANDGESGGLISRKSRVHTFRASRKSRLYCFSISSNSNFNATQSVIFL